jgi:ABC-type transport system involved in multi-copper enzyme maturation permease subunit
MSTATLATPLAGRDTRPGLARLTAVELRKMTDTRAGFWLLLGTVALVVAAVAIRGATGDAQDHTLRALLAIAVQPVGVLLPIVGILLVSSEWSQRTSLLTFTLVPHRSRVLAAKLAAGVVLSIAALQVCVAVSVLGTVIAAPGVADTWSLPAWMLGQTSIYVVTGMIMGIGFGAMLLASAPAIVLYFALPIAWTALGSLAFLEPTARWLDGARSMAPMTEELMSATQWARVGTTLALWMLLPLLIGLWRVTRGDVR